MTNTTPQSVFTPTPADLDNITAKVEGNHVTIELGAFGPALTISFEWDGEDCYHWDLVLEEESDGDTYHRCEGCGECFEDPRFAEDDDANEPRFGVHVEHWGCNLSHHRKA